MKKIGILGSTGSIGTQTLEIVDEQCDMKVIALSANQNVEKMVEQIKKYRPLLVCMMDKKSFYELEKICKKEGIEETKLLCGMEGLVEIAEHEEIEMLVTAVVGMIGLEPTVAAIRSGKDIALANKETLVTAGEIIMPLAKECGVHIYPVDSEHSAIYQSIGSHEKKDIEKIILTASGGPFRGYSREMLNDVTLEKALQHPNWEMGHKITIDSATLMNKGLEVIEAKWLFDVEMEQIDVVVHPQSIIHSMVQFVDGSVIGQLGLPDMKLPIQYALYRGERVVSSFERMDVAKIATLTFENPDMEAFPCLYLAFKAMKYKKTVPTVLNVANEVLVAKFMKKEIRFVEIPKLIEEAMDTYIATELSKIQEMTLEHIVETKIWTENYIESRL